MVKYHVVIQLWALVVVYFVAYLVVGAVVGPGKTASGGVEDFASALETALKILEQEAK